MNEYISLEKISKYISLILRHKPEVAGITLDEHGWANVNELVAGIKKVHPNFDTKHLYLIVMNDEKRRYSLSDDMEFIRANQGHSIPVDVELKLTAPPDILYHGTGEKYVESIKKEGLIPKSRLYVHLSKDKETAYTVGKRHGKPVIFAIAAQAMTLDGCEFYLSENGVWLTKEVPAKYMVETKLND